MEIALLPHFKTSKTILNYKIQRISYRVIFAHSIKETMNNYIEMSQKKKKKQF